MAIALSDGPRVAEFIESFCRPSKTAELLRLRPWQREVVNDLYRLRPDGIRRHRQALIGMPRKNGKSTLGASLALEALFMDKVHPAPEVYSVAGDLMQADIVFREAKSMVLADPELAAACRIYRWHIEVPETGAVYRVLSADAPRAHGLNPTFVIFDEVWVQPNEDLWEAMTTGMAARLQPMIVGITTAGFNKQSLCGRLYERGKRIQNGEIDDPSFYFRWWEPDNPQCDYRDPVAWQQANPAYGDFLFPEFLKVQSQPDNLSENSFRRFHLNQWTATHEAWLPYGAWAKIARPDRKVDPMEPVVIFGDGSWTGDSTGLIGVTVSKPNHVFVIDSWEPTNGIVDANAVDETVVGSFKQWNVRRGGFDPFLWRQQIAKWKRAGLPIDEWPTNSLPRMVPACSEFYQAVLREEITHDGDPRLARHINNAVVKEDRWGRRIVKDAESEHIDLAVCAVGGLDVARKAAGIKRVARGYSF